MAVNLLQWQMHMFQRYKKSSSPSAVATTFFVYSFVLLFTFYWHAAKGKVVDNV